MSVAALVGGYRRQRLGGGFGSAAAGSDTLDSPFPTVELFLGEQWVDISDYVTYRTRITITRGRPDWSVSSGSFNPSTCRFELKNQDGRFSRKNPAGPYYRLLDMYTPVRVSIVRFGIRFYRFHGEISAFPAGSDITGRDAYVVLTASGISRRLQAGKKPLQSALRRRVPLDNPLAYWPMEDQEGSTTAASGLPGGRPMITQGVTFGADDDLSGSGPLPSFANGGLLSGSVPRPTGRTYGQWNVEFLYRLDGSGPATYSEIFFISTTGTVTKWSIQVQTGDLKIRGFAVDGTLVVDAPVAAPDGLFGQWVNVNLRMWTNGPTANWEAGFHVPGFPLLLGTFGASFTGSVGNVTAIGAGITDRTDGIKYGHVSAYKTWSTTAYRGNATTNFYGATSGFTTEYVGDRLARLTGENGITYWRIGDTDTVQMGPQRTLAKMDLLTECATAGCGVLYEPRDGLGLTYRDLDSLYNQAPRVTLDYARNQLSQALAPTGDDQGLVNDVTVSLPHGSSARSVADPGRLGPDDPPAGAGQNDVGLEVNVATVQDAANQAGWRVHLGTVDEDRLPSLSLNLRHPEFTENQALMTAALSLDIGDVAAVDNPPVWGSPDTIRQIVVGMTEMLGSQEVDLVWNCTPASPYDVGVVDDSAARADSNGSTLLNPVDSTQTQMVFTTPAGSAKWVRDPTELPFNLDLDGETVALVAVGSVLNSNAGFENGTTGWTATNATLSASQDVILYGTSMGKLVSQAGTAPRAEADHQPVTAGSTYWALGYLYTPDTLGVNVQVSVNWYDSGGTLLSTSVGASTLAPGHTAYFRTQFTAPVGSASAGVLFGFTGTPGLGFRLYGDQVALLDPSTAQTNTQTVSVVRSVNGAVLAHPAGAPVSLASPSYVGL